MNINDMMSDIINKKNDELNKLKGKEGKFSKINEFEGNAIGQIGEEFVKKVFKKNNIPVDNKNDVTHDEYDILSNNRKIEVKTARKGISNETFQFNGLNPHYNSDLLILIGITLKEIYYSIINYNVKYKHENRKYYLDIGNKEKQLVSMNPGNTVNYKLTLNLSDLKPIENFEKELEELKKRNLL